MAVQSLKVQCQHCQTEEHFKLGHEESESSIEQAIENFHGKTQIQIRSIIRKHKINSAEYGYALLTCPNCHSLFNHYSAEVEYDDIMLFKPFHKCGPCNTTLIRATESVDSYVCRKCGEKSLKEI